MRKLLILVVVLGLATGCCAQTFMLWANEKRLRKHFVTQGDKPICWAAAATMLLNMNDIPIRLDQVASLGNGGSVSQWQQYKQHKWIMGHITLWKEHEYIQRLVYCLVANGGVYVEEDKNGVGYVDHALVGAGVQVTDGKITKFYVVDVAENQLTTREYKGSLAFNELSKHIFELRVYDN